MSKMRHKMASGGPTDMDGEAESKGKKSKPLAYNAGNSPVVKEADDEKEGGEMKKGGRVKKRADGGKVEGHKPKMRLDRPKRKDGGRVGSDKSPMSSAATSFKDTPGHKTEDL